MSEDDSIDLSGAGTSLGTVGSGLIGDEDDTTTENAEEIDGIITYTLSEPAEQARIDTSVDSLASGVESAWNDATPDLGENPLEWGPDWLDEATIAVGVLLLLIALRPYVEAGNTAAGAVTG